MAFVFDRNEILESVLIVFDKRKYSELQSYLKNKYSPIYEGAQNVFEQGLTKIELEDRYILYSWRNTDVYNSKVCTLIYKSRAFDLKILDRDSLLRKRQEEIKKQKMNLL